VIVVSVTLAIIAWSARDIWISVAALVCVFTLAFTMLWRLISFADRNPQAALLEGAEFLAHEQLTLGIKSKPEITLDREDRVQPIPIDQEVVEIAGLPDQDAQPSMGLGQDGGRNGES
jgi:hypothetical protein